MTSPKQLLKEFKEFKKATSSLEENSKNLSIGQQMARDGITYSPDREDELIGIIYQYLKKDGRYTERYIRGLMNDPDFIPDQLSDLPKQGTKALDNAFNHKEDDWSADFERRMKNEAEEDAFMSKLGGLKTWQVVIFNNYYAGKYSDYRGKYYTVLASSAEQARQVVLDNADAILQDLLSLKDRNGRKTLPRGSAVRITPDRIGKIEDGTVAGRISTAGYKKMYSPQGVMMVKLSNGAIEDVQGQEQGVMEGSEQDDPYKGTTPANGKVAARNGQRLGKTYKNPHSPKYHKDSYAAWDRDYNNETSRLKNKGVAEGELATYLVSVMDSATGEHWRIEVKVTSPEMAKERAEAMGYKVLGVKEKSGMAEGYPKHQDLSGVSTEKLKAYLAKQGQHAVPGEGNQVERVRAELQRRKKTGDPAPQHYRDQLAKDAAKYKKGVAEGWFTDLFKKKQAPVKPTISAEEFEQKAKSWKKAMINAYKKIPELIQLNQWAQVKATASKVKNGLQKGIKEGYIIFESPEKAESATKRVNSALNVKIFDEIKVNIKPEDFAGGGTGALLGLAVGGIAGAAIGGALGSSRRANKQTAQQLAIANAQAAAHHKTTSNRQDNKEAVIQRITKFEPTFIKIVSLPTKTISNNPQTSNTVGRIEPTLEQGVAEGFSDDFAAFAKERGGKLRHGPQPTKPAAAPAAPQPAAPVDREALSAELKQLKSQFDPHYQYSDDYSFWSKQDAIAKRIAYINKQLSVEEAKETEYGPEWDEKIAKVKKLASQGPMKTVYDPVKRVYKNVPTDKDVGTIADEFKKFKNANK